MKDLKLLGRVALSLLISIACAYVLSACRMALNFPYTVSVIAGLLGALVAIWAWTTGMKRLWRKDIKIMSRIVRERIKRREV